MINSQRKSPKSLRHHVWRVFQLIKVIFAIVVILSISSCDFLASMAKEAALSVTGRSGWKTFNLTGELPPEFGVKAIVWYAPITPSASCETDDFYAHKKRPRSHTKVFEKDFDPQAHTFDFKVPLTYSIGLCAMEIARVDLKINARFGEKEWQQAYDDGGLRFVESLPMQSPDFSDEGVLEILGTCEWLFQDSKLVLELDKSLKCKGAGAYLQPNKLASKTVKFKIELNHSERPYYDKTWIKFPEGWKPCAEETKGWIWCRTPPTFKTFKMNDRTCTVYPNCTE